MVVHIRRASIAQFLVKPLLVVKRQVARQSLPCGSGRVVVVKIDFFVVDATPQMLGEDVLQSMTSAVYADANLPVKQPLDVLRSGKAAALITVDDLRGCLL